MRDSITLAEVAERMGASKETVRAWVKSGELIAVNVATRADGKRKKWRVELTEFAAFKRRRSSTVLIAAPAARRVRRLPKAAKNYLD